MTDALFESNIPNLQLLQRGKVRDIYAVDDDHMLIVTTDRLSAFDVVLPTPIPGKGEVLTQLSNFWFQFTRELVPNHLAELSLEQVIRDPAVRATVARQSCVVRRLRPLPVEAIVRGYIIGSGWKDYLNSGAVCGIQLPEGLRLADKLDAPIFTPSTKATVGEHDENINFETAIKLLGREHAEQVRDLSLAIYGRARDYAAERGIIIADTKFEFGVDDDDRLYLIDEVLTPDSSRFWPADAYQPGVNPPSFDKQYVRDYLEEIGWNKKAPGPELPIEVVAKTTEKYREAYRRLTA